MTDWKKTAILLWSNTIGKVENMYMTSHLNTKIRTLKCPQNSGNYYAFWLLIYIFLDHKGQVNLF